MGVAAVAPPAVGFVIIMPKLQPSCQMRRPWGLRGAARKGGAGTLGILQLRTFTEGGGGQENQMQHEQVRSCRPIVQKVIYKLQRKLQFSAFLFAQKFGTLN